MSGITGGGDEGGAGGAGPAGGAEAPDFKGVKSDLSELHLKDLKGKKILVTAGPTQEAIDPVRYITNHSSGKMGYSIAKAAMLRGADVTLVSGRTAIEPPMFVKVVPIVTAKEMFDAVTSVSDEQDIIIKAAFVAFYRFFYIPDVRPAYTAVHRHRPFPDWSAAVRADSARHRVFPCIFQQAPLP